MSVTIHLHPDTERRLGARAAHMGLTLEEFIRQLVENEGANGIRAAGTANQADHRPVSSFEEMAAPFAQAVEATGMTEDELGNFFEGVLREVRAEKRAKKEQSQ